MPVEDLYHGYRFKTGQSKSKWYGLVVTEGSSGKWLASRRQEVVLDCGFTDLIRYNDLLISGDLPSQCFRHRFSLISQPASDGVRLLAFRTLLLAK